MKIFTRLVVIGLSAGVLASVVSHHVSQENIEESYVEVELASPTNRPAMLHLLKSPFAEEIIDVVEEELKKYEHVKEGVVPKITAEHIISQIWVESKGNPMARGSIDEIGLMQIRPLHTKNICSAGIIPTANSRYLWGIKENIRAGMFILMCSAKQSNSVENALATYNAGASRRQYGMGYARKITHIAEIIKRGENI